MKIDGGEHDSFEDGTTLMKSIGDTFQIVAAFPCYMMSDDVVESEGHVIDVDNTRLGAPQERAALDENQMIDNNNSTSIQSSPFAIYRQDGYKFTGGYELFLKTLQSLVDPYGIHRIIIGHKILTKTRIRTRANSFPTNAVNWIVGVANPPQENWALLRKDFVDSRCDYCCTTVLFAMIHIWRSGNSSFHLHPYT